MKLGWYGTLDTADLIREAGYDYIELSLAAQKIEARPQPLRSPLPVLAFNRFFPTGLRIVGPDVDDARLEDYLACASAFMADAGAKIAVMGSAGARNVPAGFERVRAEAQILRTLDRCADHLKGTGITLVIEPLNRGESNIINSVAEGVAFARRVNRPEVRVLADFYHMDEDDEPLGTLREHRDWLAHIHTADTGRRNPGSGSYDHDRFFGLLREIGYDGMISAECEVGDLEGELRRSLAFMRRHWPDRQMNTQKETE